MKTGMKFEEFANLVTVAEAMKKDLDVDTRSLRAVAGTRGMGLAVAGKDYRLSGVAHDNLATMTGIPRRYYGRLLDSHPAELAHLVNLHIQDPENEVPEQRFVRTIGDKVRALLSTRYGVLDHRDVVTILRDNVLLGGVEIKSVLCTERRLTVQMVFPRFEADVTYRVGDVVQAGLAISNSEVGLGMFSMEFMLYRLVCSNGLILPDAKGQFFSRVHLGNINLHAIGDYANARLGQVEGEFQKTVEMVKMADGVYIPEQDLLREVDGVRRRHSLTHEEAERAGEELYGSGRWTQWGLVNAIDVLAHTHQSVDRSVELERIAGQVMASF